MDAIVIRLLANKDIVYQFPNGDVIVRVQRDFPNCQKYDKCCRMDKPFWDELEAKTKDIKYNKQPFRLQALDKFKYEKPPPGFEENIEDIRTRTKHML